MPICVSHGGDGLNGGFLVLKGRLILDDDIFAIRCAGQRCHELLRDSVDFCPSLYYDIILISLVLVNVLQVSRIVTRLVTQDRLNGTIKISQAAT